jgi:hypothetical protein
MIGHINTREGVRVLSMLSTRVIARLSSDLTHYTFEAGENDDYIWVVETSSGAREKLFLENIRREDALGNFDGIMDSLITYLSRPSGDASRIGVPQLQRDNIIPIVRAYAESNEIISRPMAGDLSVRS